MPTRSPALSIPPGVQPGDTAVATAARRSDLGMPSALAAIAGLDTQAGLKVLNGHVAAYLGLLRRYAVEHADDMTRLRACLAAGDRDGARRTAHSLKGVSGNLGVTGIQHPAGALESALAEERDAAAVEGLAAALENDLRRLAAAIRAALPEQGPGTAGARPDVVRQVLAALAPLLAAADIQANRIVASHAAQLEADLGKVGARLVQQVEHFLYADAAATLEQAIMSMNRLDTNMPAADRNVIPAARATHHADLLHAITAAANDAIITVDGAGRIAFWNPAAARIFGYAADEVLGRDLHPLLAPPRFHEAIGRGFGAFHATGTGAAIGKTLELAALRKDGTEFPIELSLATVWREDAWWGIGIVRDITMRKAIELDADTQLTTLTWLNDEYREINDKLIQAQNQLLQSEKLASLGLLAAGVAHEINNPIGFVNSNLGTLGSYVDSLLAVIEAYEGAQAGLAAPAPTFAAVDALKGEVDLPYLKQDVVALLAESRDGLERVKKIVRSLKDFSRVDTDENWRLEDIHHGIESTLNVVANELKYKCEVKKEYGAMPPVECLLSHLNQVFMNLLVNAAHAIESHGTITIRTGTGEDMAWVEIADTGKGIPPGNLARIFDPFFTTKPVGAGTGLGLSVSYSIVEKHHGRIDVKSAVGRGTTFRIWLPLRQPREAAAAAGPARGGSSG